MGNWTALGTVLNVNDDVSRRYKKDGDSSDGIERDSKSGNRG